MRRLVCCPCRLRASRGLPCSSAGAPSATSAKKESVATADAWLSSSIQALSSRPTALRSKPNSGLLPGVSGVKGPRGFCPPATEAQVSPLPIQKGDNQEEQPQRTETVDRAASRSFGRKGLRHSGDAASSPWPSTGAVRGESGGVVRRCQVTVERKQLAELLDDRGNGHSVLCKPLAPWLASGQYSPCCNETAQ
jgi:hypothetical protein